MEQIYMHSCPCRDSNSLDFLSCAPCPPIGYGYKVFSDFALGQNLTDCEIHTIANRCSIPRQPTTSTTTSETYPSSTQTDNNSTATTFSSTTTGSVINETTSFFPTTVSVPPTFAIVLLVVIVFVSVVVVVIILVIYRRRRNKQSGERSEDPKLTIGSKDNRQPNTQNVELDSYQLSEKTKREVQATGTENDEQCSDTPSSLLASGDKEKTKSQPEENTSDHGVNLLSAPIQNAQKSSATCEQIKLLKSHLPSTFSKSSSKEETQESDQIGRLSSFFNDSSMQSEVKCDEEHPTASQPAYAQRTGTLQQTYQNDNIVYMTDGGETGTDGGETVDQNVVNKDSEDLKNHVNHNVDINSHHKYATTEPPHRSNDTENTRL